MTPLLRYWLSKQADFPGVQPPPLQQQPQRPNPLLPVGALVVQPAEVTMPSGSVLKPNLMKPSRQIGQAMPMPQPKPPKLNMTKTHPLEIRS